MVRDIRKLKKLIEGGEKEEELPVTKEEFEAPSVEAILERLKKKYKEEGILREEEMPSERPAEFKEMIESEEGVVPGKKIYGSVEDLLKSENKIIKQLARLSISFQSIYESLLSKFLSTPFAQRMAFYLDSANMGFTVEQYMSIVFAVTILVFSLFTVLGLFLTIVGILALPIYFIGMLLSFMLPLGIGMLLPSSKANARAREIERELPFALRHLATEIRAGVGIVASLESVAESDYGALSDEMSRIVSDIRKGNTTEAAIQKAIDRTISPGFRRALMNFLRALRTGGSLSGIIDKIAEDTSFELRMRIRDFVGKLDMVGLIFMMVGVVLPLMISILGAIGAANPMLPMAFIHTGLVIAVYVACAMLIVIIIWFIKLIQPT